ncbi:MAG: hypothetical protein ABSC08_14460 [Bryobacteraceae bacterium]|jgi:hypothetical protein
MRGPDIIASVRFYPPDEGGRRVATAPRLFKCPLEFEGAKFDCGLHLEESGPLAPGATATVPITLLYPALIKPRLKVGSRFTLWEMRTIAEGVVEEILPD